MLPYATLLILENRKRQKVNDRCGRNESFPNQVLFALGMRGGANATLTNLFNPTSRRDTSHLCLMSNWPKEGYTTMLIRQGWETSLPDVGLNKFVRVVSAPRPIPKANNT